LNLQDSNDRRGATFTTARLANERLGATFTIAGVANDRRGATFTKTHFKCSEHRKKSA
jgi:hypothetical protein